MNERFNRFSGKVSKIVGSPRMFVGATILIIFWVVSGPVFKYSDAWQLVINTGTTIITFLMVFLIQNSQNRDAAAMQLKLDELIRAVTDARINLVGLEEHPDAELEQLQEEFRALREKEVSKIEQDNATGPVQPNSLANPSEKQNGVHMQKTTWQAHTAHGDLDTKDRDALPGSVYAFPKQRKEPLIDAAHVRNALARFDQVQDVSDEERDLAFANILKAAKHYDVEVEEDNWRQLGKKTRAKNPAH